MKIARVFPRWTVATPTDEYAFCGEPGFIGMLPTIDRVHVSVAFTYDREKAERLAVSWGRYFPVEIGGPGTGMKGEKFTPGMYLKHGYVITSRGCDRKCWFCSAWRRDGPPRELPITWGWDVLDDNLLACSEDHIRRVLAMVKQATAEVSGRRAAFTGGLEAARLRDWHVNLLADLHPRPAVFCAYDTPDDYEPLLRAGTMMLKAGWTREAHRLRCYVLIGFPGDTMDAASNRLNATLRAGFTPMAMLWRPENTPTPDMNWRKFQRRWVRPAIIHAPNY
jgi:hypothetical protein